MMTNQTLQPLPLGTSDFENLRTRRQIYVDKTALVFEIASKAEKFFIARPRRFGKSLLLSTFESLFKHGVRDFKGLAIEKLWKDTGSYSVIRLDFSEAKNFQNFDDFVIRLTGLLTAAFKPFGFHYDPASVETVFNQLSAWLKTIPKNTLVLLIDEYDAPLTACLNDETGLFTAVRKELSDFYSIIKSNDAAVRFFFMTGITKFSKTSIFSELNNFSDLTLHPKYSAMLGYTHEEVQQYFGAYLDRASKALGLERSKLMAELTAHYDGFCFDENAAGRVFVPWSLLKFLSDPERGFKDYWIESGGRPSALLQYLKSHSLKSPEEYGNEKSIPLADLADASDPATLSDIGLLTQTGYLTIRSVKFGDTVYVDYPNAEVRRAMAQLYTEQLLMGRSAGQVGAGPIVRVLSSESAESVFHILNRLFTAIDYENYPVHDEFSVRAFVQVYMAGAGLEPRPEVHNNKGRSDLEVTANGRHWVFEFKYCRPSEKPAELLRQAAAQIESRHYGRATDCTELIRVALVFSAKNRQFTNWQTV